MPLDLDIQHKDARDIEACDLWRREITDHFTTTDARQTQTKLAQARLLLARVIEFAGNHKDARDKDDAFSIWQQASKATKEAMCRDLIGGIQKELDKNPVFSADVERALAAVIYEPIKIRFMSFSRSVATPAYQAAGVYTATPIHKDFNPRKQLTDTVVGLSPQQKEPILKKGPDGTALMDLRGNGIVETPGGKVKLYSHARMAGAHAADTGGLNAFKKPEALPKDLLNPHIKSIVIPHGNDWHHRSIIIRKSDLIAGTPARLNLTVHLFGPFGPADGSATKGEVQALLRDVTPILQAQYLDNNATLKLTDAFVGAIKPLVAAEASEDEKPLTSALIKVLTPLINSVREAQSKAALVLTEAHILALDTLIADELTSAPNSEIPLTPELKRHLAGPLATNPDWYVKPTITLTVTEYKNEGPQVPQPMGDGWSCGYYTALRAHNEAKHRGEPYSKMLVRLGNTYGTKAIPAGQPQAGMPALLVAIRRLSSFKEKAKALDRIEKIKREARDPTAKEHPSHYLNLYYANMNDSAADGGNPELLAAIESAPNKLREHDPIYPFDTYYSGATRKASSKDDAPSSPGPSPLGLHSTGFTGAQALSFMGGGFGGSTRPPSLTRQETVDASALSLPVPKPPLVQQLTKTVVTRPATVAEDRGPSVSELMKQAERSVKGSTTMPPKKSNAAIDALIAHSLHNTARVAKTDKPMQFGVTSDKEDAPLENLASLFGLTS